MLIVIRELEFALFIGDIPWEKKHLQKVSVDIEIGVAGSKSPDYWEICQGVVKEFSRSHYEWLEDLAQALSHYLKRRWKVKGKLVLSKYPRVPHSPRIFQVEISF